MSKPKQQLMTSNVLLVEVPPQFIALCEASGASPQAALRGMVAMVCGLHTTATTGWCRWTAPPRDASPGAGHPRARILRQGVPRRTALVDAVRKAGAVNRTLFEGRCICA
jgi:hypothetical protein